jgi:hypothetical protein
MSVVIPETNSVDVLMNSKEIFSQIIKWFSANRSSLNYDKTNFLHFRTKTSSTLDTQLEYDTKSNDLKIGTKFLGIMMDSILQWKAHIDLLSTKLNAVCYALRTVKHTLSQQVLVMVYSSYFHSILSLGIICWGASPSCINIFKVHKKNQ